MKSFKFSRIYIVPIISVILLILLSTFLLTKPLSTYEGSAEAMTSDLGILLPEFPDHPQAGIYADNSLGDGTISITTDSHTLSAGSYNITIYYIASSNMNTLTLSTSNEYHPHISGYEEVSIPDSDLEGYSFAINSLTELKDLTISLNFEGDGYVYFTGYQIQETRHLSKHIIEGTFLVLLIINAVSVFLYLNKKRIITSHSATSNRNNSDHSTSDYCETPNTENCNSPKFENIFLTKVKKIKTFDLIALIIIVIGALVRLIQLGYIPGWGGVAQDEAFAGYEAYSLLHYGIDSHGYHMPVYLEAWGSGMNALETYLEIPFIKLLGLNSLSIRIPQLIIGILILPAFYGCCKLVRNESFGLIGLFILAISPWHIMISRWGLEANMLPAFMVFGTYFLLKTTRNKYYIYASMVCYGLALYCYAAAWVVIPLIIGCCLLYLLIKKYLTPDKHLFIALLILAIIAAPLLLFVLVNTDHLVEIVTPLISIPRLTVFRSSEVALTPAVMMQNLSDMFRVLFITQDDHLGVNAVPGYGIYYFVGPIFIVIGLIVSVYKIIKSIVTKKDILSLNIFFVIWFVWCLLHGCLVETDLTRINIIYIPLTYLIAEGIYSLLEVVKKINARSDKSVPVALTIVAVLYTVLFVRFELTYMSDTYNKENVSFFDYGLSECLDIAHSQNAETIYANLLYPVILFEDEIPATDFVKSVEYRDVHEAFLSPKCFGIYRIGTFTETPPEDGAVYICKENDEAAISYFNDNNMKQEKHGTYIIASK